MPSLALSPLAPVLGQRVPLRGPARLLHRSYLRTSRQPGAFVTQLTTQAGDVFEADLASAIEWQLWAFGGFEKHFAELFARLVKPGDRCIDVGANIGLHTVRLARLVGAEGEVVAIEPDQELARRAEHNLELNQASAQARVITAAASDRPALPAGHRRHQPRPGQRHAPRLPDRPGGHGPDGDPGRDQPGPGRADQDRR
jgi:hypothetical protein